MEENKEAAPVVTKRRRLRVDGLQQLLMKAAAEMVRAASTDVDPYEKLGTYYVDGTLIKPPYSPQKLVTIVEESSIIPKCIQAMCANIPGFGYDVYKQESLNVAPDMGESPEKTAIGNILQQANDKQSFASVRRLVRWDAEAIGNGYYEVVRYRDGSMALVFRLKAPYMRISKLDEIPTQVEVMLPRNGKLQKTTMSRRFRRYAMLGEDGKTLRWFKEFGDPRPLSSMTGLRNNIKAGEQATEVIHIGAVDMGISPYCFPRWIGNLKNVIGTNNADFVNYDVFRNQGIPPAIITAPPGTRFTDESITELETLFSSFKGVEEWNKVAFVELEVEGGGGIDDNVKGGSVKITSLADFRKDDATFQKYLEWVDSKARECWRLPSLFVGAHESITFATAKASRFVAEEQCFRPERQDEDEIISTTLFGNFVGFHIHTKGPEIIRSDELANMFQHMVNAGSITTNSAIGLVNKLFDLKIKPFDNAPWADYPIMMVKELIKNGQLVLPEGLIDSSVKVEPPHPSGPKDTPGPQIPEQTEKMAALRGAVELLDIIRDEIQTTI